MSHASKLNHYRAEDGREKGIRDLQTTSLSNGVATDVRRVATPVMLKNLQRTEKGTSLVVQRSSG